MPKGQLHNIAQLLLGAQFLPHVGKIQFENRRSNENFNGKTSGNSTPKVWHLNIWVTIEVRFVGFVDDSLACVVPKFHHRNTFKHQHQQKTPKKWWFGSSKIQRSAIFCCPRRLWDSEFASVAMWIHFASYRVGIRLHHWSSGYVASSSASFHQTTPSCWRLSGSCNSMITQLFRSWWNKSSCSNENLFKKSTS